MFLFFILILYSTLVNFNFFFLTQAESKMRLPININCGLDLSSSTKILKVLCSYVTQIQSPIDTCISSITKTENKAPAFL